MSERLNAWRRMAYRNRGPLRALAPLLIPCGWLYGGGARAHRVLYERGLLRREQLPVPVISVGNITVGGVGKTPFVLYLAKALQAMGRRPAVLTRGYKRQSKEALSLTPDTFDPSCIPDYGDEPTLLLRGGVPVGVARDRAQAARLLLAESDCDLFILDDGMQHHRLRRDLDLVMLDGARPFGNGRCLPAGPMREPATSLSRASALIANGHLMERDGLPPMPPRFSGGLRWKSILPFAAWRDEDDAPPGEEPRRHAWTLLSGIGSPERFERQARERGLSVNARLRYPDHHWYGPADIEKLNEVAERGPILTTEKDAVRLLALEALPALLSEALYVVVAPWEMEDETAFLDWLGKGAASGR